MAVLMASREASAGDEPFFSVPGARDIRDAYMRAYDRTLSGNPLGLQNRIDVLRLEARALCSEVRQLEKRLPYPREHVCIDCEVGRMERGADAAEREMG